MSGGGCSGPGRGRGVGLGGGSGLGKQTGLPKRGISSHRAGRRGGRMHVGEVVKMASQASRRRVSAGGVSILWGNVGGSSG